MQAQVRIAASVTSALAMLIAAATSTPAVAQQGSSFVYIAGVRLTCVDWWGRQVAIYVDPTLNNVGVARQNMYGQPAIILNPRIVETFSPMVQIWWFAHECAHHALRPSSNNEAAADCWAVRVLRNQGFIQRRQQLNAFAYELQYLQGSPVTGHLPGPVRAQNIAYCALS